MKVVYEDGDLVYYEGKPVTVVGPPIRVEGVPGHHVKHANGDLTLVPSVVLKAPESALTDECVQALLAHEQWEADLLINEQSVFLETLDTSAYEGLVNLQKLRKNVLTHAASLLKRKN